MVVPVVAVAPKADARARPSGRPRDHEAGCAAEGSQADEGGSQPFGLDHARPRRPPRRLRARDSHAGQGSDHDPAAGRQGSRGSRQDHRQDGSARALRPRGEPGAAVDRREPVPGREEIGLRPARGPAGTRCQGERPSSSGSSTSRRSSSRARSRRRRPRSRKFGGKVPDGYKLFAVPPGTVVVSCGVGEVVCPGVQRDEPDVELRTTSSSTRRPTSRR